MSKNLQSIDIKPLLLKSTRNYDFVLDGTHFGRGNIYISEYEQVKYKYNAVSLKKWKVNENENTLKEISPDIIEHFYSNESYVIYAKYLVSAFDLNSGNAVNNPDDVKEVYFYWRGAYAAKGCSPLPKELNVEDIPVERICQWSEPPVFLRLFNGKFIVHNKSYSKEPHLYMQCGTVTEEAHFLEVPNEKRSLRSRTSFLLVLPLEHEIYIWHGSKACNYSFCENILLSLQNNGCSIYDIDSAKDFHVTEVKEQQNDGKFLGYLHGDVNDYFALANEAFTYQHTPRLFYLNNITGEFTANEIEYTLGGEYLNAFPFLQDHLYTAPQPGKLLLFLIREFILEEGHENI